MALRYPPANSTGLESTQPASSAAAHFDRRSNTTPNSTALNAANWNSNAVDSNRLQAHQKQPQAGAKYKMISTFVSKTLYCGGTVFVSEPN